MRLTLRNMLAYMDDILEAEDAEQNPQENRGEQAGQRAVAPHPRLHEAAAAGLARSDERGGGLDPNTVAEYLDYQLPGDRVADFEKVCLESDIHLAEVASCHQILARVLGEPAEVDPESRQRMYQLPELLAAQVKAASEEVKAEPGGKALCRPPRRASAAAVVPDYLRREASPRSLLGTLGGK